VAATVVLLSLALSAMPLLAGTAGGRAAALRTDAAPRQSPSLAPYVPTPDDVVQRMLRLARVTSSDVVYDLGCGDGRIVIAAARAFGARGVGVDIDPRRIAEAVAQAEQAGVSHLVTFRVEDALTTDVTPATVVTTYLLTASNVRLRPRLTRQLRPGSRIVAHGFSMGDWEPEVVDTFTDRAGTTRTLYRWTADGRVRQ
jgi:ribosomal protein L11 methylase PrmA